MKKILLYLLIFAMTFGLLAGCNKASDSKEGTDSSVKNTEMAEDSSPNQGANETDEEVNFPLAETYTVDAFAFSNTGDELDKTLTMQEMEKRTNIHWNMTYAGQADLEEKRNISFNGGDYYDVYIKSGISAANAFKYGSQEILIPLNDLIKKYMPNLTAVLDEGDYWSEITSTDGNIYALPQINQQSLAAPSTFINQKWLDAVGKELPTTADEFLDVLRAFAKDDPNGNGEKDEYPIYCPSGAVEYTFPIFGIAMDYSTFSSYNGPKMTYIPISDEYKEFLSFWAQAYKEGLINEDCFTATWDDINAIGATSDTLGTIPTWGVYQHVGTERDEDYVALMPFNNANTIPVSSKVNYGALCISDKCEKPELICKWADYLYSEEGAILALLGAENETFTLDEQGKYHWITDGEWGGDMNAIRNKATLFGWYPAPMKWAALFDEGQSNPEELNLYNIRQESLKKGADPFPVLAFAEEELNEKSTLATTIEAYYYEYMAQVITGQLDLDNSWDDYLDNMKKMGVDRLIEINQAAYDRYLADKQ